MKLLNLDFFVSNGSKWSSGHRMFCLFSLFPLHPKRTPPDAMFWILSSAQI